MRLLRRRTLLDQRRRVAAVRASSPRSPCSRRRSRPASPTATGRHHLGRARGERRRHAGVRRRRLVRRLLRLRHVHRAGRQPSSPAGRSVPCCCATRTGVRVIVGKLVGMLVVAAGVAALAEIFSFAAVAAPRSDEGCLDVGVVLARRPRSRGRRLRHRLRRRRRLGGVRRHACRRLPIGATGPRRRVRLGGPVREHHRRLVARRVPVLPRPGAGLADPWRHRSNWALPERLARPSCTRGWRQRPP